MQTYREVHILFTGNSECTPGAIFKLSVNEAAFQAHHKASTTIWKPRKFHLNFRSLPRYLLVVCSSHGLGMERFSSKRGNFSFWRCREWNIRTFSYSFHIWILRREIEKQPVFVARKYFTIISRKVGRLRHRKKLLHCFVWIRKITILLLGCQFKSLGLIRWYTVH